ncbi:MAG TPA: extracellular solute-binding protein [Longimicrobium sp.]|nr:extracellular solute-binding protein [Longimicrobium sp.]
MRAIYLTFAAAGLAALAACGGGDERQVLTIYSPHGREMLQAFEKRYEALHPNVDVQFLDMGSQEVLDRLRSERANPQADVWWGAPSATFEDGVRDSLLERSTPTWAGAVPADAKSKDGFWYGTYLTPEVIAFNSTAVPAAQAPKDWDEVLDPKWKGKVLIRDPMASGTMRAIFGMIMQRSLRATGDTAQGWQWLRRLDAQTREYTLNPTMLYQKVARQEGVITLWDLPDIEQQRAKGTPLPFDYVIPASGTPVLVDGVGVVRGTKNAQLAREFVEWIGGPAVVPAAREFFRLPARTDIPDDSLPPRLRAVKAQLKPEPLDWTLLQQKTPEWMRYWDEHVRGKGGR